MSTENIQLSTGDVRRLLAVPEHALHSLVRYGKIAEPQIVHGRRLWTADAVLAAAKLLGKESAKVRRACGVR